MRTIKLLGLLCLGIVLFASCNSNPGEGGTGTVQGYVMLVSHPDDNYSLPADTTVASKTDVFIVYGDDDF